MKALSKAGGGRWLLFAGNHYYPAGGILDLRGAYASLGDVLEWLETHEEFDWAQAVPKTKGRVTFFEKTSSGWKQKHISDPAWLVEGCECHCGHVLASPCRHRFEADAVCEICFVERSEVHHGTS